MKIEGDDIPEYGREQGECYKEANDDLQDFADCFEK